MRFLGLIATSASFLATIVSAQNPLAVSAPTAGSSVAAGSALTITWTPDTATQVTLTLRSGAANDLDAGTPIGSVTNSGTYSWTVPADVVSGTTYTIEVADADGGPNANYSPFFAITGGTGVAASSGTATAKSAAASTVNPSSLAVSSPTAAATSAAATTGATTTTAAKTLTIKTSTTGLGGALTATAAAGGKTTSSNFAAPTGGVRSGLAAIVGVGALVMLA